MYWLLQDLLWNLKWSHVKAQPTLFTVLPQPNSQTHFPELPHFLLHIWFARFLWQMASSRDQSAYKAELAVLSPSKSKGWKPINVALVFGNPFHGCTAWRRSHPGTPPPCRQRTSHEVRKGWSHLHSLWPLLSSFVCTVVCLGHSLGSSPASLPQSSPPLAQVVSRPKTMDQDGI